MALGRKHRYYLLVGVFLAHDFYWPGQVAVRRYEDSGVKFERFNHEIQARERMGTVWAVHNLLVPLRLQGILA